jgi:hypothetical protein
MSWIERAKDKLVIMTGDGREYFPLWKEPQKSIEYNISQFEFPGVEGSIVSRGTRKGRKFPLEIYFGGENHLDDTERFLISCDDKRHWVVTHPYYGIFNAHPITINVDNTGDNVSKITISLIETIVENNPKGIDTPADKIIEGGIELQVRLLDSVTASMPVPTTLDKNLMSSQVTSVYNEGKSKIKLTADADNYFNLFNDANAAILDATDEVSEAMTTIQAMLNAPFQFIDSVKNRVNMLKNQFFKLVSSAENIVALFDRPSERRIYEHNGAIIISSMAQASVTNIDYASAEEVIAVTEILIDTYDGFTENLDTLQTDNGIDEDSYVPDAEAMIKLQALVDYTVSKLLEIALESKQERSIILEYDSNVILIAHRLYGLQADDSTIESLIATNNFGIEDLLQISAGRKIKYYK